jgi:comEA protein
MMICLAVLAVLSFMTFHILFKDHSPESLYEVFSGADWRFVGLGAACMAIYLICEAESIRTLMGAFQTKVPFLRSAGYSFADFYFSAITPSATGGQPMQLYYMTRDGFGFAQSSFSLLTLAAVYQLMVLVYGVVMVILKYPYVQSQGRLIKWLLVFGIAVNGLCSLGILLVILKRALVERIAMTGISIAVKLRIIKDRRKLERKAEHLIDEYSRGGECFRKYPQVFVKVMILTAFRLTALFLVTAVSVRLLTPRAAASQYTVEALTPSEETEENRVNINTASASELDALPGIGPVLAQRIIDRRTERGPFTSVEELLEVDGIGQATLDGLREFITVKETKE